MELEIVSGSVPNPRSETTVVGSVTDAHSNSTVSLTVLPPKTSSPLQTNKAISPTHTSTANPSNHHHSNATDTNRVSATLPPNPVTAEPKPAEPKPGDAAPDCRPAQRVIHLRHQLGRRPADGGGGGGG